MRTPVVNKLSSLLEREESPEEGVGSHLDNIVSSPLASMGARSAHRNTQTDHVNTTTPSMTGRLYPGLGEMHPSKVHQSTMKQPDIGLHLGFVDIGVRTAPNRSKTSYGVSEETPTKVRNVFQKPPSSPGFDFRFAGRREELGPEGQRIMDDVREEALRIKARLAAERQQERADQEQDTDALVGAGGRKIAKAKGKAGRFSDVHMAEFRKMDSIAGHPSAYRTQPVAAPPTTQSTLKRSKSQAKLDDTDTSNERAAYGPPPMKEAKETGVEGGNTGKRLKVRAQDDTSSARPASRDGKALVGSNKQPAGMAAAQPRSGLPTGITTPTKASLARSASVKQPKTMIPSLTRSSSSRNIGGRADAGAKSEGSHKHFSSLASLGRVKSILRRPALFEPARPSSADDDKELPPLPSDQDVLPTPSGKHVTFTAVATPSPVMQQRAGQVLENLSSPVLSLAQQSPSKSRLSPIKYPTLPPPPAPTSLGGTSRVGDFSFSSGRTMTFGRDAAPPSTSTHSGTAAGAGGSTIRHVRPSVGPAATGTVKPTTPTMPSVPHGMPNKKRHRSDLDDSDEENHDPDTKKRKQDHVHEKATAIPRPSRFPSSSPAKRISSRIQSPLKIGRGRSRTPGEKSRGILSVSRLNALARPKARRG